MLSKKQTSKLLATIFSVSLLGGCYLTPEPLVTPDEMAQLNIPVIEDNSGQYMSPITSDGVPAEWVDNAINASMGAGAGSAIGAMAGQKALEMVPFVGSFIGSEAGNFLGREAAIAMAGGEEMIRETSDLSFNKLDDLAVYLYASYGSNPNYADVLSAASEIYPDLKTKNHVALSQASSMVKNNQQYTTNIN